MLQPPAHWSKDFVEHLRAIHFTLMAISMGLIVIVASTKPYNAAVALREIHQIIELRRVWNPKWLMRLGEKRVRYPSDKIESPSNSQSSGIHLLGRPTQWNLDPVMPDSVNQDSSSLEISGLGDGFDDFAIPITNEFYEKGDFPAQITGSGFATSFSSKRTPGIARFEIPQNWVQNHTEPDWSPAAFPETVGDFRRWWDTLEAHKFDVIFPRTIENYPKAPLGLNLMLLTESGLDDPRMVDKVTLVVTADSVSNRLEYSGNGRVGSYTFPIERFVFVSADQQLLSNHFRGWKPGEFTNVFADLYLATHDLDSLIFDDAEKFIATETAKGSEGFEAFGMKFPTGQISVWGIVLLLGVQLYLYVYLRQLTGMLGPSDAGWDVPWIGMNRSRLAQTLFFLTVVVLPTATVGLLGHHAIKVQSDILLQNSPILRRTGMYSSLLLTVTLGILSWRYRPRLHEQASLPGDLTKDTSQDPRVSLPPGP